MPYWDWTKDKSIPTIFDHLDFPSAVDRMLDIKRGKDRTDFPTVLPHQTKNVRDWEHVLNGRTVQRVSANGRLTGIRYHGHVQLSHIPGQHLEIANQHSKGFKHKPDSR